MLLSDSSTALRRDHAGFSLVEVLVAMTILAGGIVAVLSAFSLSMRTANDATRLEGAAALAEWQLETAIQLPAERLLGSSGSSSTYQWKVSFSPKPQNLVVARAVVEWFEQGRRRQFRLARVFWPRKE